MGFRDLGIYGFRDLGFRVEGCRVSGLGSRVWGFRVYSDLGGFRVCLVFGLWGFFRGL